MKRILVIRGGAIGDFILTLPALQALRRAYSHAHIEILGYKHIAVLAENRFYAQAVRSIEHGPLASFFAKNSELPAELANYFASFDLIISYLYDPDGVFGMNLRRCGVDNLIHGPGKIERREHAARQLSRPLQTLGLCVDDLASKLYPSAEDRDAANTWLGHCARPIVAFHPGSGGERKNWPLESGSTSEIVCSRRKIFADRSSSFPVRRTQIKLRDSINLERCDSSLCKNLPLPHLAAVLEQTIFMGHDSGISHLAAAAGANCVLLFGPTDPAVWAPANENVRVLQAPKGEMSRVKFKTVCDALDHELMRIGIRT